jgi:glyoxylase-like metal-dependent hydrolase (beta-lactamase superfamily II)
LPVEELVHAPDGLVIRCLRNIGPYENNIFIVSDSGTGEAYVLDGGFEPEQIAAATDGLHVRGILVTHGHRDHHENVGTLKGLLKAPVAIGIDDAAMLSVEADSLIVDQQSLMFGPFFLQAIHTPGHTPGSTCFLICHHLFTGDTLFPGGPGNTNHDPVRFERIIASIRERLFTLPDETNIYPGHGRDTTIAAERPHLDEWIARGW